MQGFRHQEVCSGLSVSFRLSAISSFHPIPAAPLLPPIFAASKPWRNGKARLASPFEPIRWPQSASTHPVLITVTTP
jgi:hypothetical protein